MRRRSVVFGLLLLGACSERPPAAGSWADLDASRPDGGLTVGGLATGGGGGGGGGGTTTPPPDCGARVLVIFDRSGSMALEWETGAGASPRWRVASDALYDALEPLADRLTVGALMFPTGEVPEPGVCATVLPIEDQVSFRDGPAFLTRWEAMWRAGRVGGSTPLDPAFRRADEALPFDDDTTAVVVLTDGMPTCAEPTTAWDYAAEWERRGVSTWVVGLPGVGGTSLLDRVAAAGGTGAVLPVDDPTALTDALSDIVGEAVEQACLATP